MSIQDTLKDIIHHLAICNQCNQDSAEICTWSDPFSYSQRVACTSCGKIWNVTIGHSDLCTMDNCRIFLQSAKLREMVKEEREKIKAAQNNEFTDSISYLEVT